MNKILILILPIFIIVMGIFFYSYNWYDNSINEPQLPESEIVEIEIDEGQSFIDVATNLEEKGLIRNVDAVRIYLRLEGINPNIKFGEYSIPGNTTVPELIKILETGTFKPGIVVTLQEGLRTDQMSIILAEQLSYDTNFRVEEFSRLVANPSELVLDPDLQNYIDTNFPELISLEGLLYPDTYEFAFDATANDVIEIMLGNLRVKIVENIDLERNPLDQSEITNLYDAFILGSIIEKEASRWDDRSVISGIFHNRLEDDYFLEVDSSINFITGKNDPGVLFADIDATADNPFNLYRNAGLSPTPIANPRIESVIAALYPSETDFYFFAHANGVTYFAETFAEHNQNVQTYL